MTADEQIGWYDICLNDAGPYPGVKPTANRRGENDDDNNMSVEAANNHSEIERVSQDACLHFER